MPANKIRSNPSATLGRPRTRLPAEIGALIEFVGGDEKGRKVPLLFYRTVLGRKYGDILVRDLKVSSTHAAIEFRGREFWIVDLGSSNGTFLGKEKIKESALEEGDTVQIGNSAFHLLLNAEEASRLSADRAAESILESDQEGLTQLITREFMEAMDGEEVSISRSKKATEPRKIELRIVTGPDQGKTLTFEKSKIVIGRMQADAKIRDVDVSRKHAVLEVQEEGEVLLRDLASTNGTFVNGKRISNCVLSSGDRLQVGATQLIFSLRGHS